MGCRGGTQLAGRPPVMGITNLQAGGGLGESLPRDEFEHPNTPAPRTPVLGPTEPLLQALGLRFLLGAVVVTAVTLIAP